MPPHFPAPVTPTPPPSNANRQTIDALYQVARQLTETASWLERTGAPLNPDYAQRLRVQLGQVRELADTAWQSLITYRDDGPGIFTVLVNGESVGRVRQSSPEHGGRYTAFPLSGGFSRHDTLHDAAVALARYA